MQKTNTQNQHKTAKTAQIDLQKRKTSVLEKAEEIRKNELATEIIKDFEARRDERKPFELGFLLCMNFALGNQHAYISRTGEIEQDTKTYAWETKEVYNHIAPVLETRLAKLSRVRPSMHVRPSSADEADIESCKMASSLLSSSTARLKLDQKIAEATLWSEVCGTAFYEVSWNSECGCMIGEDENGEPIFEGDADITVCPPFEIFPDCSGAKDIDDCASLIHARAASIESIHKQFGVWVNEEDIDIFTFDRAADFAGLAGRSNIQKLVKSKRKGHALLITRYTKPNQKHPEGRMEIVAGGKLLYESELPYMSPCGKRYFPFVRQVSLSSVGSFWGSSIVERCIPLQRAYNNIKNHKHELLSRMAAGVLIVEDGSVDIDNLEEEGLQPGKLLVYRQSATPPRFMDEGNIPNEFTLEENRILDEFVTLSGVSEFSRSSVAPSNVSSGVALGLLVEQDDTRLSQTADYIRFAIREVARQILCMYKEFGAGSRLLEVAGKTGELEAKMFKTSHITSDDVVLDTDNEMGESPSSRKAMVMDLIKNGLVLGEDGKLSSRMRGKVLEALGFGNWEDTQDILELQLKRAKRENYGAEPLEVLSIDDHALHIEEHTKYLLENIKAKNKQELLEHIELHRTAMNSDLQN